MQGDIFEGDVFDFKSITLFLFGKEVIINLRESSLSYLQYGNEIRGEIVGRIWGENQNENDNSGYDTVTAIIVKYKDEEIIVECSDICNLKGVNLMD